MSRRAGIAIALLAFGVMCVCWDEASADERHHGTSITAASVGPRADGVDQLKLYPGSEIRDGRDYPFARTIAGSARYDGITVDGPHLLIEGARFSSSLDIYTSRTVVLRGVSVRVAANAPTAVLTRPGAGRLIAIYSDFGGAEGAIVGTGLALRADSAHIHRSHISNAGDGIQISASHVRVTSNWIETRAAAVGDHNDTVQILGDPTGITIARNRILNPNPQTSCITILGRNIVISDNVLAGGGWTMYGGADNNGKGGGAANKVRVTGNIFARTFYPKSGSFGPISYWDRRNRWRDNRFDDGTAITP
jgi:hypothetical protein